VPGGPRFSCCSHGSYTRKCDGRTVPRFDCDVCKRSFSVQTFRVNYRLHRPELMAPLFDAFVSKTTQRQAARTILCRRDTVRRYLLRLAEHSRDFHGAVLDRAEDRGGVRGRFQLDELETFEQNRRLKPVTMPLLIEASTRFALHGEAAPLPARGGLSDRMLEKKLEQDTKEGVRTSGSRAAVKQCFTVLARVAIKTSVVEITTDMKSSYATVLEETMPGRYVHHTCSSRVERSTSNPLFAINHTFAMVRDGMSRLVRRSWGASKERSWLAHHLWIWIAYRNYIRGFTNKKKGVTSGQLVGVVARRFTKCNFFEWRVLPAR
jgi:transposase-like protein